MMHNLAYSDNHRSAISFLVLYSSHSLHDFVQNSYRISITIGKNFKHFFCTPYPNVYFFKGKEQTI